MAVAARTLVQWYSHHTLVNPVLTKALTSCTLFTLGDITAQLLDSRKTFDRSRTLRISLYALAFIGIDYAAGEILFTWECEI